MSRLFAACMLFLIIAPTVGAEQSTEAAKVPSYEPGKTFVAVLPTVLKAVEGYAQSQNTREEAQKMLAENFSQRGFQIVPKDKLSAACSKRKFDPLDGEWLTKENLAGVGAEAGAALVAYLTLQSFDSDFRNMAVVKVKVLDVQTQTYVVNETCKAENAKLRKKGRMEALRAAIDKALKGFLAPYKVVKIEPEDKKR